MHPTWVRSLRDQAEAAGVAFMFKQWGAWKPVDQMSDAETDALYRPAPPETPLASRTPRHVETVLRASGKLMGLDHPDAWRHPTDMHVWRVGKSKSGRELDGQHHDGALPPVTIITERTPS